jgi:NitT/TauT family transport system permease protein
LPGQFSHIAWSKKARSGHYDVPLTFAGLFVLAAMGIVFYVVFSLLELRFTGWAHRGSGH